jgi:hypothetical protein
MTLTLKAITAAEAEKRIANLEACTQDLFEVQRNLINVLGCCSEQLRSQIVFANELIKMIDKVTQCAVKSPVRLNGNERKTEQKHE